MKEKRLKNVLQIGIVVRNRDETIRIYEEEFGIGPWDRVDFGEKLFPKLLVNEKPGKIEMKIGFCNAFDNVEFEIIEPVSESVFMDYLKEHGQGIHHVAMEIRDDSKEFHDIINEQKKEDNPPWLWLKEDNGLDRVGMEAAFIDLREKLGMIIEIYNEDTPHKG